MRAASGHQLQLLMVVLQVRQVGLQQTVDQQLHPLAEEVTVTLGAGAGGPRAEGRQPGASGGSQMLEVDGGFLRFNATHDGINASLTASHRCCIAAKDICAWRMAESTMWTIRTHSGPI